MIIAQNAQKKKALQTIALEIYKAIVQILIGTLLIVISKRV